MRKKILGAVGTFLFVICLLVTSDIQESVSDNGTQEEAEVQNPASVQNRFAIRAGVCIAFSDYSFTTESGEETGIEKKAVVTVAAANETEIESEENSEKIEIETENSVQTEQEAIPEEAVYDNRWDISLTEEEIDLLAKIVWLEASGEPVEGQEAVVEVIFNRMTSDLYPDTLYDVLSQGNPVQFVSWKNRSIAKPTETEYNSIYSVLNGNTDLLRNDTMYFSTYMLTSNLDVQISHHYFCY